MASITEITTSLKNQPLALQIEEGLAKYLSLSPSTVHQLELITTLLKHTIPEVYEHLPPKTKDLVCVVFRSTIGIGNLVARIDMIAKLKADTLHDLVTLLNTHILVLELALVSLLVLKITKGANFLHIREVDKLFFKGKVYGVVRDADLRFHNVQVPACCRSTGGYSHFLSSELVSLHGHIEPKFIGQFVQSLASGDMLDQFFDVFFTAENAGKLTASVLRRYERKTFLLKFLAYVLKRYLNHGDHDTVAALYTLTKAHFDTSVWDEFMVDSVTSRYSFALNLICAMTAYSGLDGPNFESLTLKAMVAWGNSTIIAEEPIVRQEYRTHLLLALCWQLSPENILKLMKQTAFVTSISNRLLSLSDRVKSLGVYFADTLCQLAGTEKIFNMENTNVSLPQPLRASDILLDVEDSWEILQAPHVEEANEEVDEIERALQPVKIQEDQNMSDEDDDPTIANTVPIPTPIYIRDLLAYLSSDTKSPQAFEKHQLALQTAPTLLRQKLGFGSEVSFYAEELLTILAGMTNFFDETGFEALKLNAMIAVVVSYKQVTAHLCNLLLTGDYSLQQRMCILSTMSLSARELRGYRDKDVRLSFDSKQFPSKMLPTKLHKQYMAMQEEDYGYAALENTIQNQLMAEASEEARDEIAGGKILRISSGLQKKRTPQEISISKDALSRFNKSVGPSFFFPLVAVWYESGGVNIGHYTPTLIAHFLRTLSLILHAAYPSATDINDMAREYIGIVTPVLQKVSTDQLQVIESCATGILLICDILDDAYLVTNFQSSLAIIENTVSGWWESLIEEKVKSLCAGLLLRLNGLRANFERLLMDQGFL